MPAKLLDELISTGFVFMAQRYMRFKGTSAYGVGVVIGCGIYILKIFKTIKN